MEKLGHGANGKSLTTERDQLQISRMGHSIGYTSLFKKGILLLAMISSTAAHPKTIEFLNEKKANAVSGKGDLGTITIAAELYVAICSILVFFMICGFAILEVGAVRSKNATSIMLKVFLGACLSAPSFAILGYSILQGTGDSGFAGWRPAFLEGANTIDAFFQYTFLSASTSVISGSMAERGLAHTFIIFAIVYSAVIYPVIGHWCWSQTGWLLRMGFVDIAGSGVVHVAGGAASLVTLMFMNPRIGRFKEKDDPSLGNRSFWRRFIESPHVNSMPGHSTPLVGIGTFILWMCFLPFNTSSVAINPRYYTEFQIDQLVGKVLINVILATAGGALGSIVLSKVLDNRWSINNVMMGILTSAVAICSGCLHMSYALSFVTGLLGAIVYYLAAKLMLLFRLDDPVEAVPVHLGGGFVGLITTGLFSNFDGSYGLFYQAGPLIGIQILGFVAITAYTMITTGILMFALKKTWGIQATHEAELDGLDYLLSGESAYPETYAQGDFLKFKAFLGSSQALAEFNQAKKLFERERGKKGLDSSHNKSSSSGIPLNHVDVKTSHSGSNLNINSKH